MMGLVLAATSDPVWLLRAGKFDLTFQGTVPVRKALQLSLNVPAISLLDRVGASRLSSRLKQAGANLALPKHEAPGLAMGLGGVGITLQDLVQLYSGLVRQAPHTQFPVNGSRIEMTGFGGATPRAPRTQL